MASLSLLAKYSCLFSKHSTVKTRQMFHEAGLLQWGDELRLWRSPFQTPHMVHVVLVTQRKEGLLQVPLHLLPDALLHVVWTVALIPLKNCADRTQIQRQDVQFRESGEFGLHRDVLR